MDFIFNHLPWFVFIISIIAIVVGAWTRLDPEDKTGGWG